jgi:predicted nucleic acid-binding protein
MTRVVLDTAVFVYAVGSEHPYREPCRAIVERARLRLVSAAVSVDLLQEFVHHRVRRTGDRAEAVRQAGEIPLFCRVLDLTLADARAALDLFATHERLHARDAVFAAVALQRGIGHILSPDRAFDVVAGLVRVDPLDAAGVEALTG